MVVVTAILIPLLVGFGAICSLLLYHRHDRRVAMDLHANAQVVGLHAVRHVVNQKAPLFTFERTRETWNRVCGGPHSLCGDAEGMAYAGKWLLVVAPVVFLADAVVAVVTVPLDIVESPFRKRPNQTFSIWTVSGALRDHANNPMPGVHLRIVYGFHNGASGRLADLSWATTNRAGEFQAKASGIEFGWNNSFRIDPGALKEIECDAARDDCQ